MPEIIKTDIVDDLRKMAAQMRRGYYASSAHDAEFIVEAAAREIERLRGRVSSLAGALDYEIDLSARLIHENPKVYARITGETI